MCEGCQIQVLLVDDDVDLLVTAQEILNMHGTYLIDFASSAENAMEQLSTKEYDVIVCDIQMPVTNGFEFLKNLRANGNKIPFIVFTVTDDRQTAIKAFSYGANGFVGKYGIPKDVYSTLQKCIDDVVKKSKDNDKKI
ncbi:MAG: response regulator [Candidatus Bathyarchaeia archaeon]|jgi:CheY-like chemotaxis protein